MKTLPKIHCIRLSIYVYWCQCPFSESCFPFLPNWISPSDMERAQEFKMRPRRYVYDATCLPNTIFGILPLIFQSARLLDNFVAFKFALTYFGRHRALAIYIYVYILKGKGTQETRPKTFPSPKSVGEIELKTHLCSICACSLSSKAATHVPHFSQPVTDDLGSCPGQNAIHPCHPFDAVSSYFFFLLFY